MKKQNETEKDVRAFAEKLGQFDLQELRELSANALTMRDEVRNCVNRLNVLDTQWLHDKEDLRSMVEGSNQDLKDLQKYIIGKIDVCIEADADVRRDQQILNERMQLVADDLRLLMEEHQRLSNRTLGVVEENEEMRILLGQVREDNEHLRHDNFQVSTRVLSLEGTASERWVGFAPGILYFRNWHRNAKGDDVQLSSDLSVAVGRGFLAATGVVMGNDEGLAIGDGPCRHFGTPGCFSSYYELEVDEISAAPAGSGGLYVGMSLQSGEEIAKHPRKEFDGWLVGGNRKAMTLRASSGPEAADDKLPDTFAPTADERDMRDARRALKLLRSALPPVAKGKAEEVELRDSWSSEVGQVFLEKVAWSHSFPGAAVPAVFNLPRRDFFQAAAVLLPLQAAHAEEAPIYSETDNLGEVLKRRAKELEKLSQRKPQRSAPLPRAFVTYLTRVLINYDRRSGKLWELSAPDSAKSTAEARRAQFAAIAAAVDLGIIGAYGNDAEGLLSLAKALRGLCRDNMAAKRQAGKLLLNGHGKVSVSLFSILLVFSRIVLKVAFALSLIPSELQPTEVIARLIEDFTAAYDAWCTLVDIPSSDLNEAAAATDAELRRLRSKSLADRLAQLIPDGLCMPELIQNGTTIYYRPREQALLAAAALSSLEVNLDGGEGFGVGNFAASELPAFDRPASLDPLFGPLGRSPVARTRGLDASQYLRLAFSGAVCSAVVRAVLQPLEVVKTTQQLSPNLKTARNQGVVDEFIATATDLTKEDGVRALYKGTGATILATSVMGFTSFGLNEFFRRSLEKWSGDPFGEAGAPIVLAASITSVFVSAILACPFETLRVRVMAPTEKRSFGEVAGEAVSAFAGLWAGLVPFWAREIPFSACKFLVFDLASRALFAIFPAVSADGSGSLGISALAGAVAGLASAVVSNPADVVITQISSGGEDKGRASLGSLDLWKGLGARCVYFAAAICAQFLIYDSVKELLGVSAGDLRLVLDGLRMGDRVGVLFRCNREGGALMRISVNGGMVATHHFAEAPPAEAVGFLTPVIRLAGTGKAAKLMPGLSPPSKMLADSLGGSRWLRMDSTAGVDKYLHSVANAFASFEEARQLYLSNGFLDARFFEDFGISDLRHKKVFRRWFETEEIEAKPLRKQKMESTYAAHVAGFNDCPQSWCEPPGGPLDKWLLSLGHGVRCYHAALKTFFDEPEQVFLAYTTFTNSTQPEQGLNLIAVFLLKLESPTRLIRRFLSSGSFERFARLPLHLPLEVITPSRFRKARERLDLLQWMSAMRPAKWRLRGQAGLEAQLGVQNNLLVSSPFEVDSLGFEMYSQQPTEANWGSPTPYMLQMVQVPVMNNSGAAGFPGGQIDPRSLPMNFSQPAFYGRVPSTEGERADGGNMAMSAGFKYPNDNVVMVAGQYREVRPVLPQGASGGRFHCEPAELPLGLQLDAATGTIWGTPASPPPNMDPAGPYQQYTVVQTNAAGATACNVGIKVVQFNPQNFSISHISQLEKSKYMVLVDTRRKQG
eukprot:symbB.v1.2.022576.t1/scaffold1978.1/size96278/5